MLTPRGNAEQRLVETLRRQNIQKVIVIGGPSAVSQQVVTQLMQQRLQVDRLQGADRFATAEAVATRTISALSKSEVTAFVADGRTPYDALIAGSLAGGQGGIVLLSNGGSLAPSTRAYLESRNVGGRVGVGVAGSKAISGYPQALKITGSTSEDTSAAVAAWYYKGPKGIVATTSASWGDALSGAPLAGINHQPLLLVGTRGPSKPITNYLNGVPVATVTILGGEKAVTPTVERAIVKAATR